MVAAQILRDSPLGQIARFITNGKVFKYEEELPDFKLPWTDEPATSSAPLEKIVEEPSTPAQDAESVEEFVKDELEPIITRASGASVESIHDPRSLRVPRLAPTNTKASTLSRTISRTVSRQQTRNWSVERFEVEKDEEAQRVQSLIIQPQKTRDGVILVDWYTTDDPENPQNWSAAKKNFVTLQLLLYTFTVYCASAIYTPGIGGVMEEFDVGISKASLGLSMYVIGYGLGPLLFSPLSEIPLFGRNIPYISSFFLFVILAIPTALVDNYAGLLVLRFLTGFLGSPCLATGGATVQDMYSFLKLPYAFTAWVASAFAAPALGPLLSAYAVTAKGWRWSLWEILWMSGPVLILMLITFPETSASNILLRRARRLRKATGNPNFKAQSEIDQGNSSISSVVTESLLKPLQITILDPAVLFTNVYTSLIYGIYYSFFEAFPIVYIETYHFSLGSMGIVFTCIVVGALLGIAIYVSYVHWYLTPDIKARGLRAQEHRLVPALFASMGLPAGLFIFAWTSRADVHWIAGVIGITLFATSAFVLMQCVFMYLPLSYPQYAASLFAANDLFRSALAAGSIIYAHPLFTNLGVDRGVSLLGGLAVAGIIGIWALWIYGARLRARSKFATE